MIKVTFINKITLNRPPPHAPPRPPTPPPHAPPAPSAVFQKMYHKLHLNYPKKALPY